MKLLVNNTNIPEGCPWCQNKDDLYVDYGPQIDIGMMFWIACGSCGCRGPIVYSNTALDVPGNLSDIVDEAITEWNSRSGAHP